MPSFADSFWSADYAAGLGVLFDKLQQGIAENEQVLTVARLRAEAEETYGKKLAEIEPTTDKIKGGFQRDDGASLKKVSMQAQVTCCFLTCSGLRGCPHRDEPSSSITQEDCSQHFRTGRYPIRTMVRRARKPRHQLAG